MTRDYVILVIATLVACTIVAPANATIKWTNDETLIVLVSPNPDPEDTLWVLRSQSRSWVTSWHPLDEIFPAQLSIVDGGTRNADNGQSFGVCSTPFAYLWGTTIPPKPPKMFHSCWRVTHGDCQDISVEPFTLSRLRFAHPFNNGNLFTVGHREAVNCECT